MTKRKRKHPSSRMSSLAGKVLNEEYQPTEAEIRSLAACVLSLDVTPGQNEGETSNADQ